MRLPESFSRRYTVLDLHDISRTRTQHSSSARIIAEGLLRESPDDAARHAQLGLILAGLGQNDEAIAEGKRAVELLPESQDAFDGPRLLLCSRKFTLGPANTMKHLPT